MKGNVMPTELENAIHEVNFRMRLLKASSTQDSVVEELNDRDALLLELISKNGQMSVSQIAASYPDVSESTISTNITKLWRDKMVSKTIDPENQRTTIVELTETGKQSLEVIKKQRATLYIAFFKAINVTDEERRVLIDVFNRASGYLDKHFGFGSKK